MSTNASQQQSPNEYLVAADRAFEAGEHEAGSLLIHRAVEFALRQLALDTGKFVETRQQMSDFADWLDDIYGGDGWHARKLRVANTFRDNAVHRFLPPEDITFSRPSMKNYVETLVSYHKILSGDD